jgi:hypothetical protein
VGVWISPVPEVWVTQSAKLLFHALTWKHFELSFNESDFVMPLDGKPCAESKQSRQLIINTDIYIYRRIFSNSITIT